MLDLGGGELVKPRFVAILELGLFLNCVQGFILSAVDFTCFSHAHNDLC